VLSVVWLVRPTDPASKEEGGSPAYPARPQLVAWIEQGTLLHRLVPMAEVSNAVAFLAFDHAAATTGPC
jgi:hypothetical protein